MVKLRTLIRLRRHLRKIGVLGGVGGTRGGGRPQDRDAIQFLLTKTLRGGREGERRGGDYPKILFNEWGEFYTDQAQISDGRPAR